MELPVLVGEADGEIECVVSAGTEAALGNGGSEYDSGGVSGGSHVYSGPQDLILVCVLLVLFVFFSPVGHPHQMAGKFIEMIKSQISALRAGTRPGTEKRTILVKSADLSKEKWLMERSQGLRIKCIFMLSTLTSSLCEI